MAPMSLFSVNISRPQEEEVYISIGDVVFDKILQFNTQVVKIEQEHKTIHIGILHKNIMIWRFSSEIMPLTFQAGNVVLFDKQPLHLFNRKGKLIPVFGGIVYDKLTNCNCTLLDSYVHPVQGNTYVKIESKFRSGLRYATEVEALDNKLSNKPILSWKVVSFDDREKSIQVYPSNNVFDVISQSRKRLVDIKGNYGGGSVIFVIENNQIRQPWEIKGLSENQYNL